MLSEIIGIDSSELLLLLLFVLIDMKLLFLIKSKQFGHKFLRISFNLFIIESFCKISFFNFSFSVNKFLVKVFNSSNSFFFDLCFFEHLNDF